MGSLPSPTSPNIQSLASNSAPSLLELHPANLEFTHQMAILDNTEIDLPLEPNVAEITSGDNSHIIDIKHALQPTTELTNPQTPRDSVPFGQPSPTHSTLELTNLQTPRDSVPFGQPSPTHSSRPSRSRTLISMVKVQQVPYSTAPTSFNMHGSQAIYQVYDVEMQRNIAQNGDQVREKVNLGKIFVGLSFQAALAMALSFQGLPSSSTEEATQPRPPPPPSIHRWHLFEVSMVIGFAACLIGILLRSAYPSAASQLEKVGSFFAALGCFILMSTFLSANFAWIVWIASTASLLAFIVAFCRRST